MINPNELRIGNLCIGADINTRERSIIIVESIASAGINVYSGYYGEEVVPAFEFDSLEPIPLTPEILERCGFKRGSEVRDRNVWYSTGAHKHDWQIGISQFGGTNWIMHMQQSLSINNLDYLHQLQNIYFALTGEELEIKELQHV